MPLIENNNFIDNKKKEKNKGQIYIDDNIFKKLFFLWSYQTLFIKFSKTNYKLNYSKNSSKLFIDNFNNNRTFIIKPSNFFLVIFKTNLSKMILILFLSFSTMIFEILQYVFLRVLMESFSNKSKSNIIEDKIKYSILFLTSRLLSSFSNRHRIFLENILSSIISNQII